MARAAQHANATAAEAAHEIDILHQRQRAKPPISCRATWESAAPDRRTAAGTARSAAHQCAPAARGRRPMSSSAKRKAAAVAGRLPPVDALHEVPASRSQPGSSTVSACRNSSQGNRARCAPAASCCPRPPLRVTNWRRPVDDGCACGRSNRRRPRSPRGRGLHGRRHQRRQRLGESRFGVQRWNDHGDHARQQPSSICGAL